MAQAKHHNLLSPCFYPALQDYLPVARKHVRHLKFQVRVRLGFVVVHKEKRPKDVDNVSWAIGESFFCYYFFY